MATTFHDTVSLDEMFVPHEYQRAIKPIAKRIARNVNESQLGSFTLSYREESGLYAIIDGQQRWTALHEILGRRDYKVLAIIHCGLSVEEEANLFYRMNSTSGRLPLTAVELFRGRVVAKEVGAQEILRIVQSYGYDVATSSRGSGGKGAIGAVGALVQIYEQSRYGPENLSTVLGIIREAWGDEAVALQSFFLTGLNRFINRYRGLYDRERLVKMLRKQSAAGLISEGRALGRLSHASDKDGVAVQLVNLYNLGLREHNRLPHL